MNGIIIVMETYIHLYLPTFFPRENTQTNLEGHVKQKSE